MRALATIFFVAWAGVHLLHAVNSFLGFPGDLLPPARAAGLDYWLSYLTSRSASLFTDTGSFLSMTWPFSGYFGDYAASVEAGAAAVRAFWIVYAGHLFGAVSVIIAALAPVFFIEKHIRKRVR